MGYPFVLRGDLAGQVRSLAQEVAVMHQGQIVESGAVDEVLSSPQADYTRRLLSDTPDVESVDPGSRMTSARCPSSLQTE